MATFGTQMQMVGKIRQDLNRALRRGDFKSARLDQLELSMLAEDTTYPAIRLAALKAAALDMREAPAVILPFRPWR
ncbi:hypothetical protein [Methylocystis parvus]|uniref:hypothetical protein n=1 Tax=Methylocystis parvus TaxID=134 RepID=UPI003C718DB2